MLNMQFTSSDEILQAPVDVQCAVVPVVSADMELVRTAPMKRASGVLHAKYPFVVQLTEKCAGGNTISKLYTYGIHPVSNRKLHITIARAEYNCQQSQ